MVLPNDPGCQPRRAPSEKDSRVRYGVLGMLCLLSFILYLDRICMSQAAPIIRTDLNLPYWAMGLVLGAFTVAYGLFEVPTGHWGDRYGSRGVLTRIVVWWSIFTMLTGAATGLIMLVIVRFLFGAGEAGAFPNAARVLARWFPPRARGRAQGVVITSALIGGAASPVIAQGLIETLGWRWSFVVLGIPGVVWAIFFYWWFRDNPAEHPAVNEAELKCIGEGSGRVSAAAHPPIPWKDVLTSANVWLLGGIISCSAFTTYLFFSWYPTYLQDGRDVASATSSWFASMVLTGGAIGSSCGGFLSDWLVRRLGSRRLASRTIGVCAMGSAALAMMASIQFESPWMSAACATFACFCTHLQLASWWGVVTEISGKHLGALFGLMNSLGVPGAVASQLFLGGFVDWLGGLGYAGRDQWDPAFYVYGTLLTIGATCWLFVDAATPVGERAH